MSTLFEIVFIRPQKDIDVKNITKMPYWPKSFDPTALRYLHVPLLAIILDRNGQPFWEPTLFLADLALNSRSRKGDTVRTYSEALIPWLSYLASRGVTLTGADEELFGRYRAYIVNKEDEYRRRSYSSATANLRLAVVSSFHLWGRRKKLFPSPLSDYLAEDERVLYPAPWRSGRLARRRPVLPTVIRRMPRILSTEEIQELCVVTPMPYRLMLRWSAATGMRRFEICDLQIQDLPTPVQLGRNGSGLASIQIVRKGSREHTVYVPTSLLEETNWYVLTERPISKQSSHNFVFLNKLGNPIARGSFSKAFRASADRIGSDATLHHLRHTFAVHVLGILENRTNQKEAINSLKTLQVLLGHASSVTTEIYLQAMEATSPQVIEALDYLYGATL